MKKRVFVCGFQQETNAFNPIISTVAMYGRGSCDGQIGKRTMIGGLIAPVLEAD